MKNITGLNSVGILNIRWVRKTADCSVGRKPAAEVLKHGIGHLPLILVNSYFVTTTITEVGDTNDW